MINIFNKEEFFSEPASVQIHEETSYAKDVLGNTVAAFPRERAIIINVGGQDYDVRDLVWRLKSAETLIDQLISKVDVLERRMAQQENRYF